MCSSDLMNLLIDCRKAVQTLIKLGYDKYEPLLNQIDQAIKDEKDEQDEINKAFKDKDQVL